MKLRHILNYLLLISIPSLAWSQGASSIEDVCGPAKGALYKSFAQKRVFEGLFIYYKAAEHCGESDYIAEDIQTAFAEHWREAGALKELFKKSPGFKKYIYMNLSGGEVSGSPAKLKAALKNATSHCTDEMRNLCRELKSEIKNAMKTQE